MKKIIQILFPPKTPWVDQTLVFNDGYARLIQMRYNINNNKKEFRTVKIGWVNGDPTASSNLKAKY